MLFTSAVQTITATITDWLTQQTVIPVSSFKKKWKPKIFDRFVTDEEGFFCLKVKLQRRNLPFFSIAEKHGEKILYLTKWTIVFHTLWLWIGTPLLTKEKPTIVTGKTWNWQKVKGPKGVLPEALWTENWSFLIQNQSFLATYFNSLSTNAKIKHTKKRILHLLWNMDRAWLCSGAALPHLIPGVLNLCRPMKSQHYQGILDWNVLPSSQSLNESIRLWALIEDSKVWFIWSYLCKRVNWKLALKPTPFSGSS